MSWRSSMWQHPVIWDVMWRDGQGPRPIHLHILTKGVIIYKHLNIITPMALRATYTRDWDLVTFILQAFLLVEKAEPVQVCFTLCLRDQHSMWMQDKFKVYMDSYMTLNGSCFMVTWIIFKNHLLEVGLTQNQETMALWMLTTVDLFYFIMCEGPHE